MTQLPVGAYVASALMAANIPCDSGEDVDRFLDELAKLGYMVALAADTAPLDVEWNTALDKAMEAVADLTPHGMMEYGAPLLHRSDVLRALLGCRLAVRLAKERDQG